MLPEPVQGDIAFQDVSFAYTDGRERAGRISTWKSPPAAWCALVGPTGVGKSTLVSLIPRFYDVQQRRDHARWAWISANLNLESLRQQISIVLQDVYLFYGTVRENILFGRPDASDEQVDCSRSGRQRTRFHPGICPMATIP